MKRLFQIIIYIAFCLSATYSYAQVDCDQVFNFNVAYTENICEGSTGSAQVNIINGSGSYTYEWSTNEISVGIALPTAGSYAVTVTDMINNCTSSQNFVAVTVPNVNVEIVKTDIKCYGENNGTATANIITGTGPFTYNWSTTLHTETISNLLQGTYSVTVTDANRCTGYATTTIAEPTRFSYTISANTGMCYGDHTTINVNAVGGTQPYRYIWNDTGEGSADRDVSPEETTIYTVTVLDANGCTNAPQSTRVTISQPINIDVTKNDVTCHGTCNGNAQLAISGGIGPFQYSWTNGATVLNDLCPGYYSLSITDVYGCTGASTFAITEPDTMYVSTISNHATCFGYADGYIEASVSGGVPFTEGEPYLYLWDNGMNVNAGTTTAGYHTVTVTDANGCIATSTIFVAQPEAVYVTNPSPNGGTVCLGETFTSSVNATGGQGPYTFSWTSGDFAWYGPDFVATPTETTTYTLRVTDVNGCTAAPKQITVSVNPPITITSVTQDTSEICPGDRVRVEVQAEGGNGGPYRIEVAGIGIVNSPFYIYPDKTGYYAITVNDVCGSPSDTDSVYVKVHDAPIAGFYSDKAASCPPGTFKFFEVSEDEGQSYYWNFGNERFSTDKNPTQLFEETGVYDVSLTVTSSFGCSITKVRNNMITVYENPRAEFSVDPDATTLLNTDIKFINHSEGGSTFLWNFGDENSSIWSNDVQIHTYTKPGTYVAMLVAKSEYQCVDTAYKKVIINDVYTFYAPTAFSPNGDGLNDLFYVTGSGINSEDFTLRVYNRWGERMFETFVFDKENPENMAWDGSNDGDVKLGDKIATTGPYNWVCTFVDFTGKPHEKKGTVFIVK